MIRGDCEGWRPLFYLFEAHGLKPWLVNAKDVKHLPGRPKTYKLNSVWLCKVAERQMLRPNFVPPIDIRRLRDLTRYRADLVGVRTADKNRVEEPGCHHGPHRDAEDVGGGEFDPKVLADLARSSMRKKIADCEEAFAGLPLGTFGEHHRFLLIQMLGRIDAVNADIAALDTEIGLDMSRFPTPRPSGVMAEVRARGELLSRQDQRQRLDWTR